MDKNILHRFFEGSTTMREEIQIRSWMESSEENRQAFFRERQLFDALTIIPDKQIEETLAKEKPRRYFPIIREILKIASVILLTLAGTTLFNNYRESKQPAAMQTITVPAGQYINLNLPDGTAVWLNARTTLRYPVGFNTSGRKVELDGEAYFEVTPNKGHPFIVETKNHNVEVLGTKFNVEAYSEKGNFITTLMEGKVKVYDEKTPTSSLTLTPNTKAVYTDGKLSVHNVDDYSHYRWREGLICFRNASFSSIMSDFEKYYGIKIQIKNSAVNKYHYTGKFRQTDGVDYALHILQKDMEFTYKRDDERQEITIE